MIPFHCRYAGMSQHASLVGDGWLIGPLYRVEAFDTVKKWAQPFPRDGNHWQLLKYYVCLNISKNKIDQNNNYTVRGSVVAG